MSAELSFPELLRRIQSGDEQAAAQLVRDFEPVIRRDLRFRLRNGRTRAEFDSMDICQSVLGNFFARAAAGLYDLKDPAELGRLLLTMTRNKLAERMRQQHRQRRDSRRNVDTVENLNLPGGDPTPSRVVAGKELLGEVRRRLSDEERQLADLRGQGLSWNEIASSRGKTPEAVRKQLARAIDRITQELGLDL